MKISTTDRILDAAEAGMRLGGLDAVSFRDIADTVGIKSASVHYHFPHKENLGAAVAARYRQRFLEALGDPSNPSEAPKTRVERLTGAYRQTLENSGSTCLCLTFGAEVKSLPASVATEVRRFYEDVLNWLTRALGSGADAPQRAEEILTTLVGGMVLSLGAATPVYLQNAEKRVLAGMS